MQECIFCKIVRREIPADVVYEDDDILAFKDINPVAPVHILLIPKKHVATFFDIAAEDQPVFGKIQAVAAQVAKEQGLEEKGFRLVANCLEGAGQVVFHIHYHLVGGRELTWPPG
ncbi:MAG: histidine triad nucleotide-binding protein [Peptococcaceae bacterium]|nr:histidine triad nucleotide-binding protein [Peptococcaceae bacterium]